MIQTTIFARILNGLNRDIEPKEIKSPSGIAPRSVTKNSFSVCRKPIFSALKTTGNCSIIKSMSQPRLFCFLSAALMRGRFDLLLNQRSLHAVFLRALLQASVRIAVREELIQLCTEIRTLSESDSVLLTV